MNFKRFSFRYIFFAFFVMLLGAGLLLSHERVARQVTPGRDPSPAATGSSVSNSKQLQASEAVQRAIAKNLPKEIGVPIQAVSCPTQETLEAGNVFDCKVQITQGRFPVKVTVKDAEGNLNFRTRNILRLSEAETQLQQAVKQRDGATVKADCGGKVKLFQKVGETFNCKLTNPTGQTSIATITAISNEGKVDVKWSSK